MPRYVAPAGQSRLGGGCDVRHGEQDRRPRAASPQRSARTTPRPRMPRTLAPPLHHPALFTHHPRNRIMSMQSTQPMQPVQPVQLRSLTPDQLAGVTGGAAGRTDEGAPETAAEPQSAAKAP